MLKDEETKVPPEGQLRGHAVIDSKRLARIGAALASENATVPQGGNSGETTDSAVGENTRLETALAPLLAEMAELQKRVAALENAAKVTA